MAKSAKFSATLVLAVSCLSAGVAKGADLTGPADSAAQMIFDSLEQSMVSIGGGEFRMGNSSGKDPSTEKPVHVVVVKAFRMGAYEVTFDQYDAYVRSIGRQAPTDQGWGRGSRPVINVSWDEVQGFITWVNEHTGRRYRLPSEAEWEYAARAGSATAYPWGAVFDSNLANGNCTSGADRRRRTAPSGSFPPNAWGLYDMIGNVAEWTADCWNASYVGAPVDGSAWQEGTCEQRVFRGGSWAVDPVYSTVYFRMMVASSFRNCALGFRLAEDL